MVQDLEALSVKDVYINTIYVYTFFKKKLISLDSFHYGCTSSNKCNDEKTLKKFLSSLVIEDRLQQEILPLIEFVSPFDPKTE
jgi:hypothetical protein